jgi:hypothetical protein
MQFVRAPDQNVYVPPLNLLEIVIAGTCEWWMSKRHYEYINDCVMGIVYSPLILGAAIMESRTARDILENRSRGDEDDDSVEEWEQMAGEVDFEGEGWAKKVALAKSNVEEEPAVLEVRQLRTEIEELKALLLEVTKGLQGGNGAAKGKGKEKEEAEDLVDLEEEA